MRIIAGESRGRALKSVPKDMMVKPISARIKKSVFDILRPRLEGSRVLDLYAGTGAVGIEALSRGAGFAFFVDADKRCIAVIEQTLMADLCVHHAVGGTLRHFGTDHAFVGAALFDAGR